MAKITYINKVEKIDAGQLASSTFLSKGVSLEDGLAWEKVCLVGLAALEIEEKVEAKSRIFHHSLKAKLSDRIEVANHKWCFRLTAVDGSQYIVGTSSRPYPMVKQVDSHPSEASSSCAVMMEVDWRSTGIFKVL